MIQIVVDESLAIAGCGGDADRCVLSDTSTRWLLCPPGHVVFSSGTTPNATGSRRELFAGWGAILAPFPSQSAAGQPTNGGAADEDLAGANGGIPGVRDHGLRQLKHVIRRHAEAT